MAEQLGMTMKMPTQQPNTRLTHEAVAYVVQGEASLQGETPNGDNGSAAAPEPKASDLFIEGVFKAYWEDDRDIGDIDVLCEIAKAIDLDAAGMRAALESRELAPYVEEKLAMAKSYGISAVPSLIINNKYLLRGLPAEEHLLNVLRQVKNE